MSGRNGKSRILGPDALASIARRQADHLRVRIDTDEHGHRTVVILNAHRGIPLFAATEAAFVDLCNAGIDALETTPPPPPPAGSATPHG